MYRLKMLNVVKETDSTEKRDFLISQGYTLLEEAQETEKAPEEMTLPELKRYAAENGVDIFGLKTKKEIADAIRAAEEAADDGGENDADNEGECGTAG